MRRWWPARGGVAVSVAAGLLAVGCAGTPPVTSPGHAGASTKAPAPATAQAKATAKRGHRPRLGGHHRIAPARPGRVLVRHRQLAGAGQRQRPLPCAGHRRCLRRLRGDGRELVVLAGLPRRLPGLVLGQQCAGRHQLHQVRSGHRHRGLLVHGRTRRRPWLQRDRRRGRRLGRAAGGADAGQHGQGARHLPGRVHGHRTAGGGARIRQRLGGRLQLAVQRAGKAPRHARRR